jgi:hypothetical protein
VKVCARFCKIELRGRTGQEQFDQAGRGVDPESLAVTAAGSLARDVVRQITGDFQFRFGWRAEVWPIGHSGLRWRGFHS